MGEVCSTYPSAGSVYHWAGQLATASWAPLVAFITGWFNFMGNVAGDAAFAYGFASFVTAAQEIRKCPVNIPAVYARAAECGVLTTSTSTTTSSDGNSSTLTCLGQFLESGNLTLSSLSAGSCTSTYGVGSQVGIAIGVCFCWAFLNLSRIDAQGWLNNGAMAYQIATTVAIVATLCAKAGQNHDWEASSTVWQGWRNDTGLSDKRSGYVILVGLAASLYSFSGYEAGAHMAEETRNASRSSALGLLATVLVSAAVGLLYILGIIYSIPRSVGLFSALTTYSAPVPSLFAIVTGNNVGLILTNVIIANLFFAGVSSFTVTTRIGFAMARDDAFPGSSFLKRVHPSLKSPIWTVLLVLVIDCMLLLLPLATMKLDASYGPVAFNAVTSICVIGYQMSYCVPLMLRATTARKTFLQTNFNLGRAGLVVANLAWVWLFITSLFLFWPTSFPVDEYVMNYTVVVSSPCVASSSARHPSVDFDTSSAPGGVFLWHDCCAVLDSRRRTQDVCGPEACGCAGFQRYSRQGL
jgi:amino acid transporter